MQYTDGNLFQEALWLFDTFRWSVVPTVNKTAACKWTSYQTKQPTPEEIMRMFKPSRVNGVAVITGEISGNLAIRDFDTPVAYDEWAKYFPKLAATLPTVKSPKGFHVYFRGPSFFQDIGDGEGEYRGDASHYTLAPPSILAKGGEYRWLREPYKDLPYLEKPWEYGLCEKMPSKPLSVGIPLLLATTSTDICTFTIGSVEFGSKVQRLAELHKPKKGGQRNKRMLNYIRSLRRLKNDWSDEELLDAFQAWWGRALSVIRTKDEDYNYSEFLRAFTLCKTKAAFTNWEQLAVEAIAEEVPYGMRKIPSRLQMIIRICARMQRIVGNQSFFLASADAGRMVGLSQQVASSFLLSLCARGYLRRMEKGSNLTGRASSYYYLPIYNPDEQEK
jgi:hypothetical protein